MEGDPGAYIFPGSDNNHMRILLTRKQTSVGKIVRSPARRECGKRNVGTTGASFPQNRARNRRAHLADGPAFASSTLSLPESRDQNLMTVCVTILLPSGC